jgi:hypothetical protein
MSPFWNADLQASLNQGAECYNAAQTTTSTRKYLHHNATQHIYSVLPIDKYRTCMETHFSRGF